MKNLTKSLIAAAVLATSAMSHAAPVLTWNVATVGLWTAFAPNAGVTRSADQTLLSWGTPSVITPTGQSSLKIQNPDPATSINTYFGGGEPPPEFIAPSIALTHNNNPITGTFLTSAQVTVGITLTPTTPAGDSFPLQDIEYNIKFKETPNNVRLDQCAVATSLTPCDDIFVLLGGFLNESFDYDGFTYFVNAFPTEGGTLRFLEPSECAAAGEAIGCFGFTTPERQSSTLAFGLTISSERLEVPEPGSLALLGLGLAGLAAATRRKQKQA
jgi:hypothetical protein